MENQESKNLSWAEAVAIVRAEQSGKSPALLVQRAFENVRLLSDSIEALFDAIEDADLSRETADKIKSLADTLRAFGHDGDHLAERFENEWAL